MAQRLNLKTQRVNGGAEWHGANPWGGGATRDGFILFEDGRAWDRAADVRYTSWQVAELAGVDPKLYQPCADWVGGQPARGDLNGGAGRAASASSKPAGKGAPVRVIHHKYHDAGGRAVMRVTRREYADGSKSFIQEHPEGRGWAAGAKGIAPVLFDLPSIATAEIVALVEGEKNAVALNEALEAAGRYWAIVATTSAGGAGRFCEEHAAQLAGKHVVILPDNDAPGEKHLQVAAPLIFSHAARVQVLRLPGLPAKGDICDWLAAGGTVDGLLELMAAAPEWTPEGIVRPFTFTTDLSLDAMLGDIKWLWPGYIPIGFVTALVGDQDMGKSSVAQGLCDTVLRGTEWPDGQPWQAVDGTRLIWVDTEGAVALFHSRLMAWQMPRGHFIFPENSIQELRIDEPGGWFWLETAIEKFRPPLVVIDALSGAHKGKENDSGDMKTLMKLLGDLAQRHQIAIIAIHHLNKPVAGMAEYPITLHRMRGSSAISQFCRSVLAVGAPDASQPERRRLDVIKLNLAPKPQPVGYELSDRGPLWGDAPEMPRAHRVIDDAVDFLREALDGGPRLSDELLAEAKARGIGNNALNSAKKALGVRGKREGGKDGRWFTCPPAGRGAAGDEL